MSTDLQELLETIDAPPPLPGFRDRVYEIAADRDNSAARRLRVALVVAVVPAVAALSSTAVLGFGRAAGFSGTYDKTFSCPVPVHGGVPVLHFEASGPPGWLQISLPSDIGNPHQLFSARGGHPGGVTVDAKWCSAAPKIPLARGKLRLLGSFGKNGALNYGDGDKCFSGARIVFRLHALLRRGSVEAAQLAVETGAKLHPFLFADWGGVKTTLYGGDACAPEA